MLKRQILVSAPSRAASHAIGLLAAGVLLAGCGQRGPLYLPTDPAAANRATLPQVLTPTLPALPDFGRVAPPAAPASGALR
ncbi:MAG: hypothetical protein EOO22_03230 [Comamonadaceae bacterium]|nr:MAG: hypothetical protein EOO22_03230 [Comamonadaceae bacterium]